MFCEYCDTYIEEGSSFCPCCGAPVTRKTYQQSNTWQNAGRTNTTYASSSQANGYQTSRPDNPDEIQHSGSFAGSAVPFTPVENYEPKKRSLFGRKKR